MGLFKGNISYILKYLKYMRYYLKVKYMPISTILCISASVVVDDVVDVGEKTLLSNI